MPDEEVNFSDGDYAALERVAAKIVLDGEADVEVAEGEVDEEAHADDENGDGYYVSRVVIMVTKVKPAP